MDTGEGLCLGFVLDRDLAEVDGHQPVEQDDGVGWPQVDVPAFPGAMWSMDGVSARGVPGRRSTRRVLSWQIPQTQLSRSPISAVVKDSTGPAARILSRRRETRRRFAAWPGPGTCTASSVLWQGHSPVSGRPSPQDGQTEPIAASLAGHHSRCEYSTRLGDGMLG